MTDAEVWLFDEDYVRKAVSSLMRGHLHGLGLQKLSLGLPVLLSSGTIKEIENCRGQKGPEHTEKCQRSQGSSHTVCFSSGVRCGAAPPRMPGRCSFPTGAHLLSDETGSTLTSQNLCFYLIPGPFPRILSIAFRP